MEIPPVLSEIFLGAGEGEGEGLGVAVARGLLFRVTAAQGQGQGRARSGGVDLCSAVAEPKSWRGGHMWLLAWWKAAGVG